MNTLVKDRQLGWRGPEAAIAYDAPGAREHLQCLTDPCYVVRNGHGVGVTRAGQPCAAGSGSAQLLGTAPPLAPERLGDAAFRANYGLTYAYMAGAMANAIASVDMVVALGRAGMLGSFGAGGLTPERLEAAIRQVQAALPAAGPYAFNLIHSPNEPALERRAVELYLRYRVRVIEASAYLRLTPAVVRYRVAGLERAPDGSVRIQNRVIAKLSRREVAAHFMQPPPERLLSELVTRGEITAQQAALAAHVPMADDVTVEADSGGHTDNRPLTCLLPSIIALRDELQARYSYATPVRVGAGGGIGTPEAALGAFMMGAAYIVTGSVNHSCVEAGTSPHVKQLLAEAAATDVMMAPAADMFELGVNLQVLKRGTMFPLRARKLYELYRAYDSLEALPAAERAKLERQVFQRPLEEVWEACISFFEQRDPEQVARAQRDPKHRMALVFRWYLGLATRWGITGDPDRKLDYQIWCGPAMGAFNDWVRGSYLEAPAQRAVADVARHLLHGAAVLYRAQSLRMQGVPLSSLWLGYTPQSA